MTQDISFKLPTAFTARQSIRPVVLYTFDYYAGQKGVIQELFLIQLEPFYLRYQSILEKERGLGKELLKQKGALDFARISQLHLEEGRNAGALEALINDIVAEILGVLKKDAHAEGRWIDIQVKATNVGSSDFSKAQQIFREINDSL